MSETGDDIPDDEILAGEYALGVHEATERAHLESRMESDTAFAAMVWRWVEHLAPLTGEIAAVAPSPEIRTRLMASLFGEESAQHEETGGFWQSLVFWRSASVALGILLAIMLAVLVSRPARVPVETQTILFASLAPPNIDGILSVQIDPATGLAAIDVTNLQVDDLYTELWVIPEDGTPRSLGVFPADGGKITLPEEILEFVKAGVALAVSLEDLPTGSATGLPSNRVIALGTVRSY